MTASIAKTRPYPNAATRTPAAAGPNSSIALRERLSRAFASWSWPDETICGTSAVDAGWKNDAAIPNSADDTASCHTSIASVKNASAISAWTTPRTTSADDHHGLPWQTISPDAAGDDRQHAGAHERRHHVPEIRRRPDVEHRERRRDGNEAVADSGQHPTAEQQPERALVREARDVREAFSRHARERSLGYPRGGVNRRNAMIGWLVLTLAAAADARCGEGHPGRRDVVSRRCGHRGRAGVAAARTRRRRHGRAGMTGIIGPDASRFRSSLDGLVAYEPGKPVEDVQRELGLERVVKLASNEGPFGPFPVALEAIERSARELNRYPDGGAYTLRAALAERHGVDFGEVIVCAGADAVIGFTSQALLEEGDEIVTCWPSFPSYVLDARKLGATPVLVPLRDHRFDLDGLLDAITERTKIVYVATPNNPTGTMTGRDELDAYFDRVPEHVLTVVDQAYFEYIDDPAYPNAISEYAKQGHRVLVLRTFSKIYGLAGLRVGYGVGAGERDRGDRQGAARVRRLHARARRGARVAGRRRPSSRGDAPSTARR